MPKEQGNGYDRRRGPRDRAVRVGDREREAVAEILRRNHVEGRLDPDEFQDRLELCLAAKTYRELDQIIEDLPGNEATQTRLGRAGGSPLWRVASLPLALIPFAVVAAIVLSGGHLVWLVFPLLFFFVWRPLVWRSWACGRATGHAPGRACRRW
jgi:uncharacterized protein DUF1707